MWNVDEGELEGDLDDATWGMIVSLLLNLCNPNFEISTPSMRIRPLAGSISLLWERCLKLVSTLSAVKFNGFLKKFKVKFNSKRVKFNSKS